MIFYCYSIIRVIAGQVVRCIVGGEILLDAGGLFLALCEVLCDEGAVVWEKYTRDIDNVIQNDYTEIVVKSCEFLEKQKAWYQKLSIITVICEV